MIILVTIMTAITNVKIGGLFKDVEMAREIHTIYPDSKMLHVYPLPPFFVFFQIRNTLLAECRTAQKTTEINLSQATLTQTL